MNPLCIALVSLDYPPDPKSTGIGTYSKLLAHHLSERGHTVHVVTRGFGEDTVEVRKEGRLSVHRLGQRPEIPLELNVLEVARLALGSALSELSYRRKIARKLDTLIKTQGVQLIESSEAFADSLFYKPAKHPHIPFIVKLHTPFAIGELFDKNIPEFVRLAVRHFERRLILSASHVTIPSAAGKDLFRREMRLGNLAIRSLANPPQKNLPVPSASGENEVLFVGRVTRFKGVEILIKAIPDILEQKPKTQFVFVGADAPQSGEFSSTIESLKARLPEKARAHVTFTGYVQREALDAYYARAAVCVFPSLFEVFGYTCLEAMYHAKAIVGSANGGMRDLLDGGRCGHLYCPPDAQDLAMQIVQLLSDKTLRQTLGERARERALSRFGAQRILDETETFYREAIEACR